MLRELYKAVYTVYDTVRVKYNLPLTWILDLLALYALDLRVKVRRVPDPWPTVWMARALRALRSALSRSLSLSASLWAARSPRSLSLTLSAPCVAVSRRGRSGGPRALRSFLSANSFTIHTKRSQTANMYSIKSNLSSQLSHPRCSDTDSAIASVN